MGTVFLVSEGEYSSERTVGIFATREKAEAEKILWPEANDIQEWELDVGTDHAVGCLPYWVTMRRMNGDDAAACRVDPEVCDCDEVDGDLWGFSVWATDEKHAIEIANDRRAAKIARQQVGKVK